MILAMSSGSGGDTTASDSAKGNEAKFTWRLAYEFIVSFVRSLIRIFVKILGQLEIFLSKNNGRFSENKCPVFRK